MSSIRYLFAVAALLVAVAAAAQTSLPVSPETEPDGALTIDEILELALTRSPELAAAEAEVRAREGRVLQARSRPNPELSVTSENHGGDDDKTGGAQSTLQLGQRLELGGDRAARGAAAIATRDLARWDLESRRLDVVARATRAFIDVLSAQKRVELATDTVRLAEEVRTTVAARIEAGKVSPIEETRAEVALATERIERDRVIVDLQTARSRLAATWGSTSPAFDSVVGDLESMSSLPSLESVAAQLERNPEIARWTAEVEERQALLRVERARAVPDVTVGGGYRHFELGSSAFLATVALPLPLFDRNRGAQIETRERVAQAQEERRSAMIRLRQVLDETYGSLVRAQSEVRVLREQVVPGAESVYAAVSEGYRLGKFGYMEVLDARRTLAVVRSQLVRVQAEMQRAAADLQRLSVAPMKNIPNGERR